MAAKPFRQGTGLYENPELNVVVDAGTCEIGAGDERRGAIRNHAFRMQASSRCEERLACFERPPVEVGGRLERLERVLRAEHERAPGLSGVSRIRVTVTPLSVAAARLAVRSAMSWLTKESKTRLSVALATRVASTARVERRPVTSVGGPVHTRLALCSDRTAVAVQAAPAKAQRAIRAMVNTNRLTALPVTRHLCLIA